VIFSPDLCELILAGKKTVTRRPVKWTDPPRPLLARQFPCRYKPGRSYAVQPGRGKKSVGRIRVLTVIESVCGAIDDEDARREGFRDAEAFHTRWRSLYGDMAPWLAWRIEFELVQANQGEK
jgi:hypothetical protein